MKSMKNLAMAAVAVLFTMGAIAQTEGAKQSGEKAPASQESKKAEAPAGTVAKPATDHAAATDTTKAPK
ncbi:MAG: hypothetical protein JST90_12615 [Bacteroidetes bacterium]|nr:hypothetical protein [Bacteroidota bacterium]